MSSVLGMVLCLYWLVLIAAPATAKEQLESTSRTETTYSELTVNRTARSHWVVSHFRQHGVWDAVCDYPFGAMLSGHRCYIRLVTKLKQSEGGGAFIIFLAIDGKAISTQMIGPSEGRLAGWLFQPEGIEGYPAGRPMHKLDCRDGRICDLDAVMSKYLVLRASTETGIRICLEDADGKIRGKVIPITGFARALEDVTLFYGLGPFPKQ